VLLALASVPGVVAESRAGDAGGAWVAAAAGPNATAATHGTASPASPMTAGDVGAAAAARRARVVARVGEKVVTVGTLEDDIAALPPFQRAALGDDPKAVSRSFLNEVVVREELLAAGAEARKLGAEEPAAHRIERAISGATLRAVRSRVGPASAIPMEEVVAYYDRNRARYDAPERYQIWRILCKTRDEAQSVLDAAMRDPTPATFGALAREHSLDKATNLRAGNLGFLDGEGASSEPGLRVDPGVVRAAQGVRDSAFVPSPVAEGENFAVVWRRTTIAPVRRTVADAAAPIRDLLWKAHVKEETEKLLASLRAARVRDLDPSALAGLDLPDVAADVAPRPHAAAASSH
jgi:peptidyl-prolyl cis-trans isomerase C